MGSNLTQAEGQVFGIGCKIFTIDGPVILYGILPAGRWEAEIEFKEYELEARTREEIVAEIRRDVEEGNVHALTVDFKLDTTADVIKGWEIIEFMHEETPEFPVVIMTNAPDESKESQYTNADKVYAKKVFLKLLG